jgi:hypothetical protein
MTPEEQGINPAQIDKIRKQYGSVANFYRIRRSNRLRVWVTNLRSWKTGRAYRNLTNSMKKDRDYAHVWQCNIACVLMDEGLDYRKANRVADHLMKHLFNVTDD